MAQGSNPNNTAIPQNRGGMVTGYQPSTAAPPAQTPAPAPAASTPAPAASTPAPAVSNPTPMPSPVVPRPFTSGQNVYDQSSNAYTQALQGTQGALTGMPNTAGFMNPYTQQVVDASTAELERQRQIAQQGVAASATESNAYGGSRQGVAEAETNRAYADMQAQMLADLYSQGYDKSLAAAQAQQNLQLQAANQMGNLSQTGFGFGQDLTNTQWQQGALQQALNQALVDAGKAQWSGFSGAPAASSSILNAATGTANMGQGTTTQTQQPGLADLIASFAGVIPK